MQYLLAVALGDTPKSDLQQLLLCTPVCGTLCFCYFSSETPKARGTENKQAIEGPDRSVRCTQRTLPSGGAAVAGRAFLQPRGPLGEGRRRRWVVLAPLGGGRTGALRSRARWAAMRSAAIAHGPLRNRQLGIPWRGSLYSTIMQTPAAAAPRSDRRRRGYWSCGRSQRGGSSQNGGAHGSGSPILCPAEPVNKTPTWPRLRNRRRRLARVTESGGRRAKDFTALPPPRGDFLYSVRVGGGRRGRWRGTRAASASEAASSQRGAAERGRGSEARRRLWRLPRAAGAGGGSAGLRVVRRRSTRGARTEGALLADRGEPAMSDRAIQRCTELTRSLPALNYCLFHFSACLMNKPAIRLMLPVTLSSTQVQNVCMGLLWCRLGNNCCFTLTRLGFCGSVLQHVAEMMEIHVMRLRCIACLAIFMLSGAPFSLEVEKGLKGFFLTYVP